MSSHLCPPRPWPLANHPAFKLDGFEWAVVSCFFNPAGYRRPVANLGAFLDWCYAERIPVYMAELVFHDASPVLQQNAPPFPEDSSHVLQFRMGDEGIMFQKEALLNAVVRSLPRRISSIIFMDADVVLDRGLDALESTHFALQDGAHLVQPFGDAVWCDAASRPGKARRSTGWAWDHAQDRGQVVDPAVYHPGFAYGIRRELFDDIGGLYGCPITGTGDAALWQAALAHMLPDPIKGRSHYTAPSPSAWRKRIEAVFDGTGDASYVAGTAKHFFHGRVGRRFYDQRHNLLARFRPERDLRTHENGLPAWAPGAAVAEDVRRYFFARAEDE